MGQRGSQGRGAGREGGAGWAWVSSHAAFSATFVTGRPFSPEVSTYSHSDAPPQALQGNFVACESSLKCLFGSQPSSPVSILGLPVSLG